MRSHWIATTILLGAVFCAAMAPQAAAQIAAPSIVPGTFSSENPAVIKWGAPSRVGFGVGTLKNSAEPQGASYNFVGASAGLRLVGESFAFGLEALHAEDREDDIEDKRDVLSGALAIQTGNSLAWGLGYVSDKKKTDHGEQDSREQSVGISIRLGEVWFLGAAIGREAFSSSEQIPVAPFEIKYEAERQVVKYGLGFRRGGTVLVHAEVFAISKEDFDTANLGKVDGVEASGGTLEFALGSFLIAGSATRFVYSNSNLDTIDSATADIGWAPRLGLAVTAHFASVTLKPKDPAAVGVDSIKEELTALVFTWQF